MRNRPCPWQAQVLQRGYNGQTLWLVNSDCFQRHRGFHKTILYLQQHRGSYVQLTVSKWLSWGADFLPRHVTVTRHVDDPRGGARALKPPPLLFIRHQPIVFSNLTALFLNSLEAGANLLHVSSIISAYSAS